MRPAFDALFAIDDAIGEIVARSTQPALGAIKLAWWRERLEELDSGMIPAEPRLRAAADELLPRGIAGAELAELEEGWAGYLSDPPEVAQHGTSLFRLGARLLSVGFNDSIIGAAGRLYSRVNAKRRGITDITAGPFDFGRESKVVRRARPLTALAALAARDLKRGRMPFEPEGTPGRAWTLLRHRLTGRLPR